MQKRFYLMSLFSPWLQQNRMHGYSCSSSSLVTEQNIIPLMYFATLQRAQKLSVKLAGIQPSNETASYKNRLNVFFEKVHLSWNLGF